MMTSNPLVSAVIITYNQEQYIAQTIDYVLAQETQYDFEIVIGEDCSTDRTREIVCEFQERYPEKIRVVTSDKNVGLLENFYRTVRAARGKYVAGCAGDDYWHRTDKLQKQVQFLEEHPDYGMVHSDTDILKQDEGRLIKNVYSNFEKHFNNQENNTLDLLFKGRYPIVAPSAVFRKQFFDDYFDLDELKENGIIMEDMPLWISIAARSKIYFMPESLIVHREMKGTISSPRSFQKKIRVWESCHRCFSHYYEPYRSFFKDPGIDRQQIDIYFNRIYQKLAMESNEKELVREYYRRIAGQSGGSFITGKDRLRYCFTYVPFGTRIFNLAQGLFSNLKALFGKTPKR